MMSSRLVTSECLSNHCRGKYGWRQSFPIPKTRPGVRFSVKEIVPIVPIKK